MDADHRTLFYFGIFDGHGGSNTADFLTANLDHFIEDCTPDLVPRVTFRLRQLGGYFRHFVPPSLKSYLPRNFDELYPTTKSSRLGSPPTRKVQLKGKGGRVRPMIFIPHPNATENDQVEDIEALEGESEVAHAAKETPDVKQSKEPSYQQDSEEQSPARTPRAAELTELSVHQPTSAASQIDAATPLTPASLQPTLDTQHLPPMTLEQRLSLAFLQCDTELIQKKYRDGSTASVVLLQSKGAFWESDQDLELVMGHVGDTRVLLCEAPRGECVQLSTDHHPDAIVETERIRKLSGYVSRDSFGENMFLGRLANTRSIGDMALKPFGVSAEPEITRRTLLASKAAFLVLISDGISSVMSNQEVVDCVKLEQDPTQAAAYVLNLAEQLGAEDNCTVLVVRLPAWGTPMPDLSKELREYRWQSEAQMSKARRR
ncbi:hypothetical protein DFQ26_009716 [Actinomortierella ambigua]|nr:hypothetical protein DFQ26_009716 [Actinomortierella ambigua]